MLLLCASSLHCAVIIPLMYFPSQLCAFSQTCLEIWVSWKSKLKQHPKGKVYFFIETSAGTFSIHWMACFLRFLVGFLFCLCFQFIDGLSTECFKLQGVMCYNSEHVWTKISKRTKISREWGIAMAAKKKVHGDFQIWMFCWQLVCFKKWCKSKPCGEAA